MFVEHKELLETFGNNVEVSEEIDVASHDSHNVNAQVEPNPNFNVLQYKIWLEYVATGVTQLTDSQVVKVSKFSSTVYGCMSYYFDHVSTFENDGSNNNEEFHSSVAHTSMKPESLPHASVLNESESFLTDKFEPVKRECKICSDEFLIEDMYLLNCSASHAWCLPCLVHHIRLCVLGDIETQPHIPACPLANGPGGCNYLLEEHEMAQVVQLANEFYQDSGDLLVGDREAAVLKKAISSLCMAKAHRDHNHMRCVNCSGDDEDSACWFTLPNDTAQQPMPMCVQCPRCQTDFCSQCRRSPCHYRSDCADVVAYSRAWNEWLQGGRDVFIVELQRQTSKLQQFEANRKEIADAEARFAELQQMEKYKEDHCRRCPNCQRTVEKLSGCDSMVCGQNAHGGDVQNGCGRPFDWGAAPRYVADVGAKRTPAEIDIPPAEMALLVRHEIFPGEPLLCDDCREPIVGPCVSCLNCSGHDVCLACSVVPGSRGPKTRGVAAYFEVEPEKTHREDHICTILFRNETGQR